MTNETDAKKIMKLLCSKMPGPNERVRNAQVQDWCIQAEIDGDEQLAALEYAGNQGWIEEKDGWTHITQSGWDSGNA